MILTSQNLQMGTTKTPANAGEKSGPTGTIEQAVTLTPTSATTNSSSVGQNASTWFSNQGKDLGAGVFSAIGDRVGSTIRYGGASSTYPAADTGYAQQSSLSTSPLVIGGIVLAGLALTVAVLKK